MLAVKIVYRCKKNVCSHRIFFKSSFLDCLLQLETIYKNTFLRNKQLYRGWGAFPHSLYYIICFISPMLGLDLKNCQLLPLSLILFIHLYLLTSVPMYCTEYLFTNTNVIDSFVNQQALRTVLRRMRNILNHSLNLLDVRVLRIMMAYQLN